MGENKFDHIYRNAVWPGDDSNVPLSGPGSSIESSAPVLAFIRRLLAEEKISSILDLGCGDLTYVSTIDEVVNRKIEYCGIDVSQFIIQENTRKKPWFKGRVADIRSPQVFNADLLLVKDLLFHLDNDEIVQVLRNLARSSFKYCLVTSMNNSSNIDRVLDPIDMYSNVNVRIAPFFCKNILHSIVRPQSADKSMKDNGEFLVFGRDGFSHYLPDHAIVES